MHLQITVKLALGSNTGTYVLNSNSILVNLLIFIPPDGCNSSLLELIPKIKEIWSTNKDSLISESKKLTKKLSRLQKSMTTKNSNIVDNLFDKSFNQFTQIET